MRSFWFWKNGRTQSAGAREVQCGTSVPVLVYLALLFSSTVDDWEQNGFFVASGIPFIQIYVSIKPEDSDDWFQTYVVNF